MSALKAISLSGLATGLKILSLFFVNKLLAVYVGPSGYAAIGHFQNFMGLATTLGSASIGSGVVTGLAKSGSANQQTRLLSTAFWIVLTCSLLCTLLILGNVDYLTNVFLKHNNYTLVMFVFAASLTFQSLGSLTGSMLNGWHQYTRLFWLNVLSMVFTLGVTAWLASVAGTQGALLSLSIAPLFSFLVGACLLAKLPNFEWKQLIGRFEPEQAKLFGKYATMAIFSALLVPISQLLVRDHIIQTLSLQQAGLWQGVTKISDVYLLVITSALGMYYLPTLAAKKNNEALLAEIIKGLKIFMPLVAVCSLAVYLCREFIIDLLFTPDFAPMKDLFAYQLLGDVFKIASWLLGNILVVKAATRWYLLSELFYFTLFIPVSLYLVTTNGLIGATQAFMLSYIAYLLFMVVIVVRLLKKPSPDLTPTT